MKMPNVRFEALPRGDTGFPVAWYHLENGSFAPHWQNEFEMLLTRQGRIQLQVDGQKAEASAGQVVFINPGSVHGSIGAQGASCDAVVFPLGFLSLPAQDTCQAELIQPVVSGKLVFPQYYDRPDTVENIIALLQRNQLLDKLRVKLQLYELLLDLHQRSLWEKADSSGRREAGKIKEILIFLQGNIGGHMQVEQIAERFGMSKYHFCRFFKKYSGQTLVEYRNRLKITYAASLLEQGGHSVTEVALECGFDNLSYFIRTFKGMTGKTPGQYELSRR